MDKKIILKVLVGSRADGLADKDSDYDYRAVYVTPTSEILSLNHKYKGTHWIEDKEDNVSYEIGHFLQLATKSNPTILEVFKAPVMKATEDGKALLELFPYVWNPKQAFDAFTRYGFNQRKKFLEKKDNRQNKYAVAYLRTLVNLGLLLNKKTFSLKLDNDVIKERLLEIRKGNYQIGEIIDIAEELYNLAKEELPKCKQEPNIEKVNEFLINIRRRYW